MNPENPPVLEILKMTMGVLGFAQKIELRRFLEISKLFEGAN